MQRFFNTSAGETNLLIDDMNFLNQLNKVLRSKKSDRFIFFDGKKSIDYIYSLELLEKRSAEFVLIESITKNNKKTKELNLYNSLPNKIEKIELILQKGVEVGYSSFNFFRSDRSQKLTISDNKFERMLKIIIESVEQSDGNFIPELNFVTELNLKELKGNNLFFHTENNKSKELSELSLDNSNIINLFVGPEGGFSNYEIEGFEKNDFQRVYLGDNILRTETVGMVCGFYLLH